MKETLERKKERKNERTNQLPLLLHSSSSTLLSLIIIPNTHSGYFDDIKVKMINTHMSNQYNYIWIEHYECYNQDPHSRQP